MKALCQVRDLTMCKKGGQGSANDPSAGQSSGPVG
ncbi:hypothetical protein ALP44_200087 [Pseudomonas syringae pv. theae]|uniref:Uncharacterized protein n=1 Tax=Pseudomonas syringae pv. theae TaxID=103985 RepID=A0A3M5M8S5_PSESX|nr:hypothetical protein ALP44_200087 [Pseudomonas syringae pv. theae]